MTSIGLRELRQQASTVVRRVEAGESIVVTVQGRGAARLVPLEQSARVRTMRASELARRVSAMPLDDTGWAAEAHALRDDEPFEDPWRSDAAA